ncbi:MAG TPA: TolC family protein, partial [Ferruginibacter sp.]|nr:TolC family protein [Ferruginibacter sp.]
MKTKIKLALILCLCVAFSMDVNAQSSSKLNLKACIDMALANNIAVKQSDLLQQVAKLNYDQAKFDRLPNVSADVNYGINSGRSIDPYTNAYSNQNLSSSNAALTASVPVFRGLQIQNNIKQTSLTYQATKMELQQQKDNLILNVILAFLQVINDEDVLALTKKQIDVTSKQVERLDQLNKEGAIAPATFYDMKGQYATDQLAVLNSARSLEMSKLGLAQFMNIPYSKDMQVDREGTDLTIAAYAGTADNIFSKALQDL